MRQTGSRRCVTLAGIAFLVLMVWGCDHKSINEIKADPSRYANHKVTIIGEVTRSVSMLGRGGYEISDGTGKLWVISEKGVPREGAKIAVKGTIRDAYNLGSFMKLPDPIKSGLVMIESSHKAR